MRMQVQVQMRRQKEWVLAQRELRMPAKRTGIAEETQDDRPQQRQPDAERYLLQIDRQTKRSFKTPEAAR